MSTKNVKFGASHLAIKRFEIKDMCEHATIAMIAKSKLYQNEVAGYVTLGCVIRGETTHYDYVCLESARGINKLAIKHQLAIGYGIITVENKEQAIARADVNQKNKGGFASQACIEMIKIKEKFIE